MGPGYNPGMEAKRGRPQHPGPVTPAESRVLELVQAGVPNAEIAVRLGVSVNTVRYHVSNLLAKAGVGDRRELARWKPKAERPERRGWALFGTWKLLAAVGGAGLVVFAAAAFLPRSENGEEPAFATAAVSTPPPPRSTVIGGRTMLDAGPLFVTQDGVSPVKSTEARESLVVIELVQPSMSLALNGRILWTERSPAVAFGRVDMGSASVRLEIRPATDDTTFTSNSSLSLPRADSATLDVRTLSGLLPAVIVWAGDRHAEIGTDGHLYIEAMPIANDAVVAYDTGERLDVSRATRLGPLDKAWTLCASPETEPCFVIAYVGGGPVLAPLAGVFRCRPDGLDELSGSALRLEFRNLQAGSADRPCEPAGGPPRDVLASDALFPSFHTLVTAFGADGKPVSLAVARDGTLYAGDIPRRFGCPCRPGN